MGKPESFLSGDKISSVCKKRKYVFIALKYYFLTQNPFRSLGIFGASNEEFELTNRHVFVISKSVTVDEYPEDKLLFHRAVLRKIERTSKISGI